MKKTLVAVVLTTILGTSLCFTGVAFAENNNSVQRISISSIDFDNRPRDIIMSQAWSDSNKLEKSKNDILDCTKQYQDHIKAIEEEKARIAAEKARRAAASRSTGSSGGNGSSFKSDGVWSDDNYRYTYYSSNVLRHYRTSEWTPDANGVYRDKDGYAVVASDAHAQGTVISGTLFGDAKVYDTGVGRKDTLDVYTNF